MVILLSIASFYLVFFLFNILPFNDLFFYFFESLTYPIFFVCNALFLLVTFPVETFVEGLKRDYKETKERREK
jgi:hypothetical protein